MTVTSASVATEQTQLVLQRFRSDSEWTALWESCKYGCNLLLLEEPAAPRARRPPRRIDGGSQPAVLSVENHFKLVFYEFLDTITGTVTERMNQKGMQLYTTIENSLIAAGNGQLSADETNASVTAICSHFKDNLNHRKLLQAFEDLPGLMDGKPVTTLQDIITKLVELGAAKRLYAQLVCLVTLLLVVVMPPTSATAKRSFSSL